MMHSNGNIDLNQIKENDNAGIQLISESKPHIESNSIEKNCGYGIEIQDPSKPMVSGNTIRLNNYQIRLEEHGGKKWKTIQNSNIIDGENDVP